MWPFGKRPARPAPAVDDTISRLVSAGRAANDAERERRARESAEREAAYEARKKALDAFCTPRPPMKPEEVRAMLADLDLDSLRNFHHAIWAVRDARWGKVVEEAMGAVMCDGGEGPDEVIMPRTPGMFSLPSRTLRRARAVVRGLARANVDADAATTILLAEVEAMIEEKMQAQIPGGAA